MTETRGETPSFAQRIKARETLLGTFIKVPTTHTTEVVGSVGFDFIVIDQEHAPFDRLSIDGVILASLANGMPALVRIGDPSPANILAVLDCGAAGVLVPHVDSAEKAAQAAAACRYRSGSRGFSRTGRAGGYGAAGIAEHIERQDAETLCIAMIEDVAAIERIDAIAATEGIDAVFIGRGDLSVAMGEIAASAPRVQEAVKLIAAGVARAGKPLLTLAESVQDRATMAALGASSFLVGSDLAFLRRAAQQALADHTNSDD
jgi:staphyloferrin B biosynthesis citrate synthase